MLQLVLGDILLGRGDRIRIELPVLFTDKVPVVVHRLRFEWDFDVTDVLVCTFLLQNMPPNLNWNIS